MLDRSRDLELKGRGAHTRYRRIALGVLALIVVAALLNVFGQGPTTTTATGDIATLTVEAPPHLRGGLIFQARFEIEARQRLAHPTLKLSSGWLKSTTLNSVVPTPVAESTGAATMSMRFEPVAAGQTMTVWTAWQVNPTNVGRRDQDTTLLDGSAPIATADRTVTVFP